MDNKSDKSDDLAQAPRPSPPDTSLTLFLVYHEADVATRVCIRTLARDTRRSMPVFGLDRPMFKTVCAAFKVWKGGPLLKKRRVRCSNSWARPSRARRTDDTPILSWVAW